MSFVALAVIAYVGLCLLVILGLCIAAAAAGTSHGVGPESATANPTDRAA
jgi:hypothetical protein